MKAIVPVATPVLVELVDGQPTTTSLDVAAHFGKLHKTVLRAIANLECSPEFTQRNFVPSEYTDSTGRKLTQYRMTRDGFTFLCMGFTGKEAAKWKEAYISAFNKMEAALQQGSPAKERRAPKALPNGLSTDQQDAIKALVKARVDELPEAKRAKAAITCWSSLKSKFGCSYKKIAPEQFTEAVSLIARVVLEGELLEAEQAKPLEIDFPVSRWLKDNPWIAKRKQFQGPGNLSVSADMLYGMDARSPTRRLLSDLRNAGYNIDACWIEVLSMQHHLEVTRSYLRTIQSGIDNTLHQAVRFKVGESEKGSKE